MVPLSLSLSLSFPKAQDMEDIYNQFIEEGERRRVSRLEMFDEIEEVTSQGVRVRIRVRVRVILS